MNVGKHVRMLLLAAPLLAGCAGFWQNPTSSSSSSSGCTNDCTTLSSGDFYLLTSGTSPQVQGEAIDSGKLTAISGSPWTLTAPPYAMAISPSGNDLYVSTSGGVYVYPISSGSLETASAVGVSTDVDAVAIAVDTSGKWLVEALETGTGSVTMAAVPLNTSNGTNNGAEATVSYSVTNAAVQNGKIAVSPDDAHVFVALGAGGTIAVPFNAGVSAGNNPFGNNAPVIAVAHAGGSALSVAVDPGDALFYIGESLGDPTGTTGGLRAFTLSSLAGTLAQATGSPIASGGLAPNAILPATSGSQIYVANGAGTTSAGNITTFNLTSGSGAYTIAAAGTHAAAGIQPFSLAKDANGNFLLAISELGDPYFSSYTFDTTTTGKLDVQLTATTGTAPLAVVAAP